MNRGCGKLETYTGVTRIRSVQIVALLGFLYMIFMTFEVPFVYKIVSHQNDAFVRPQQLALQEKEAAIPQLKEPLMVTFYLRALNSSKKDVFSELHKSAITAFELGGKLWEDLKSGKMKLDMSENQSDTLCRSSISVSGAEFLKEGKVIVLPCGLTVGSHITVVAKPRLVLKDGDHPNVNVSQFVFELIGSKPVDGEDPPKIFHYNPRLKGDWSGKAVIEQNTCYRQQWGTSVRCEGWKSKLEEETGECLNQQFNTSICLLLECSIIHRVLMLQLKLMVAV